MPLTRLSLEERIKLVRYFSMYEKSSYIQKVWKKDLGKDPPSRKTIAALNKKFDETGSVADLGRSGRPKSARTDEKVALVQEAIKLDPTKSIRQLSSELCLNKAAIHRIKQESENQKSTMRTENKKLKEKIMELQRRLDILEGRKPEAPPPKKLRKGPVAEPVDPALEGMPPQPIVSTIPTSYHPSIHLIDVDMKPTVITVMSSLNPDDLHLHTHEMVDTESGEVHHITLEHALEDEDEGQLIEEHEIVEHDIEEHEEDLEEEQEVEQEEVEHELVEQEEEESEMMDGEIDEADAETQILATEEEILDIHEQDHEGVTKFEPPEEIATIEMCYITTSPS